MAAAAHAIVFVSNIVADAGETYLRRLFAAYGAVHDVKLGAEGPNRFATIEYESADDADCAIAALHLRYCTAPGTPMLVLFAKESPVVSEYGKRVGQHYREAVSTGKRPAPIPLEQFDPMLPRGTVCGPPTDFTLPRAGVPHVMPAMSSMIPAGLPPGMAGSMYPALAPGIAPPPMASFPGGPGRR